MSTTNKLTYLNTTEQKLKQAINNLGGEITSQTTFRQYANQLQTIYDNAPKTSYAEGTEITLSNTLKGKLDYENDIVGYGDTKQNSTTGANLLPLPFVTRTLNGITITNNGDGTYTLNGTSTDISYFDGEDISSLNISCSRLICLPSNWVSGSGYATAQYTDSSFSGNDIGNGATVDNTKTIRRFALLIQSGKTFNNVVIKPMLTNDTTRTYATWEPYTNGASPNPSYPQEIQVVRGKNLFNPTLQTSTINGVTCTRNSDNTFTLNGTATAQTLFSLQTMILDTNKTYTLSGTPNGSNNNYFIAGANFTDYGSGSTAKPSRANITFSIVVQNGVTCNNLIFKPMLEKGTQATSYLPYNTIEVGISNENILPLVIDSRTSATGITLTRNEDNSYLVSGTATALNLFSSTNSMVLKANTTYTLGLTNGNSNVQLSLRNTSGTQLVNTDTIKFVTYTPTEDIEVRLFVRVANGATVNETIYPMLVYGNVALSEYTPHQEQTYQLSLGEYELYTDSTITIEDNKCYINNKFSRYEFTGNETWFKHTTTSNNLYYIPPTANPIISNMKRPSTNSLDMLCYSNIAPHKAVNTMAGNNIIGINPSVAGDIYIGTSLSGISDRDTFKTYLQNNKSSFIYELITPTKEEITGTLADQIKALYKAMSYNGTTNIEVVGNLPMIMKVRALKGE